MNSLRSAVRVQYQGLNQPILNGGQDLNHKIEVIEQNLDATEASSNQEQAQSTVMNEARDQQESINSSEAKVNGDLRDTDARVHSVTPKIPLEQNYGGLHVLPLPENNQARPSNSHSPQSIHRKSHRRGRSPRFRAEEKRFLDSKKDVNGRLQGKRYEVRISCHTACV